MSSRDANKKKLLPGRAKPYTDAQIRRALCFRCGHPASAQWNICALEGRFLAICMQCDVELNAHVLSWMGVRNHEALIRRYLRKRRRES